MECAPSLPPPWVGGDACPCMMVREWEWEREGGGERACLGVEDDCWTCFVWEDWRERRVFIVWKPSTVSLFICASMSAPRTAVTCSTNRSPSNLSPPSTSCTASGEDVPDFHPTSELRFAWLWRAGGLFPRPQSSSWRWAMSPVYCIRAGTESASRQPHTRRRRGRSVQFLPSCTSFFSSSYCDCSACMFATVTYPAITLEVWG
mmetsp:Transcript_57281/g.136168  ORF Transcript_57281/g.136168 Transcript_57281/m.136168 type:complete len:204 (+) Transcript_57281:70-681(+)